VAYIIVVTLAAPAMIEFGFSKISSHMFVFYFGVLSMITPPVEVAAYAAADIAKADPIKVGFSACRIAMLAFIVPYVFLFEPALLMEGPWIQIAIRFILTLLGVIFLAGSITGWFFQNLKWRPRLFCLIAALLIISPGIQSSLIGLFFGLIITFIEIPQSRQLFKKISFGNQ
jgi:TRAP-type uncharacterized transport system fused permease subunit